jgi:hypothetical protein
MNLKAFADCSLQSAVKASPPQFWWLSVFSDLACEIEDKCFVFYNRSFAVVENRGVGRFSSPVAEIQRADDRGSALGRAMVINIACCR